jgi:hypothetical protein
MDGVSPTGLALEALSVGNSRVLLALPASRTPRIRGTTSFVSFRQVGSTITVSARHPDSRLARATQAARIGRLADAVELVGPYVRRYRARKTFDYVEAATVAYVLLRAGELDSLTTWIDDLIDGGDQVVDCLILAAEWYAEAGCHLTALNLLSRIPDRGLPLLSGSYGLAKARLVAYGVTEARGATLGSDTKRPTTDKDACMRGQSLELWNVRQAGKIAEFLSHRISNVDWSEQFLKVETEGGGRRLRVLSLALRHGLATRLDPSWVPLSWQLDSNLGVRSTAQVP